MKFKDHRNGKLMLEKIMSYVLVSLFLLTPVWVLQASEASPELLHRLSEPQFPVLSLDVNQRNILAAGTRRGDVHLWKIDGGEFLKTISFFEQRTPESLTERMKRYLEVFGLDPRRNGAIDLVFSPSHSHRLAVLYGGKNNLRIWDLNRTELLLDDDFLWAEAITFAHQGVFLGLARRGGRPEIGAEGLQVFNTRSQKVHRVFGETLPIAHRAVAFSPPGNTKGWMVASGADDGIVRVWKVATGKRVLTLTEHAQASQVDPGSINDVIFSPDGQSLVTASGDQTVGVWSFPEGDQLRRLNFSTDPSNVAFSPSGSLLAVTHSDTVVLFSTRSWQRLTEWNVDNDRINDLAFSSSGRVLTVGGGVPGPAPNDYTVTAWKNPFFDPKPPGKDTPPGRSPSANN